MPRKITRKITTLLLAGLLIAGLVAPAAAAEATDPAAPAQAGITIQQAFDLALANSNSLKQSDFSIQQNKEYLNQAQSQATFTTSEASTPDANSAITNLVSAQINWESAEKTKSSTEDTLILQVFQAYTNVIKALENLNYQQASYKNAQTQWNIALINYQIGMISSYQKDADQTQYNNSQNSLNSAQVDLNTAYQALDKLLGYQSDYQPVLAEKPAYSQAQVADVETLATQAVADSPAIWLAKQNADKAQLQMDLYTPSVDSTYLAQELNVDKANLSVTDAQQQLRQTVRNDYNTIQSLEQTYATQVANVNSAEDTLRVKNIQLELGLATNSDVQAAQLDLSSKQNALDATIFSHEYYKMALAKPWA